MVFFRWNPWKWYAVVHFLPLGDFSIITALCTTYLHSITFILLYWQEQFEELDIFSRNCSLSADLSLVSTQRDGGG